MCILFNQTILRRTFHRWEDGRTIFSTDLGQIYHHEAISYNSWFSKEGHCDNDMPQAVDYSLLKFPTHGRAVGWTKLSPERLCTMRSALVKFRSWQCFSERADAHNQSATQLPWIMYFETFGNMSWQFQNLMMNRIFFSFHKISIKLTNLISVPF